MKMVFQWVKADRIIKIIRCKVGISHRLMNVLMPQNFLQCKDIATRHHEVRSERMAQHMNRLPCWQIWGNLLDHVTHLHWTQKHVGPPHRHLRLFMCPQYWA